MPLLYQNIFGDPAPRPPAWMRDFLRLNLDQQLVSINLLPAHMQAELRQYLTTERVSRSSTPIPDDPLDLSDDGADEYKEAT
jgi:hypothetical protein